MENHGVWGIEQVKEAVVVFSSTSRKPKVKGTPGEQWHR